MWIDCLKKMPGETGVNSKNVRAASTTITATPFDIYFLLNEARAFQGKTYLCAVLMLLTLVFHKPI